jgi:tRNA A-37 threonylcarbamoyl transferase component Bud32
MSLDEQFSPGTRVGNYEVMSKIGQGGMGGVFLVQQVFLKKRFALKVLNDELAALPEFVDVFRHEAQMLATLHHPHIVQIHDFGVVGDRHYFVMDYIEGGTLDEFRKSRGGKLPPAEALAVLRSIASGLAHAHALGIVHRDLKPENFLMDVEGVVKITDFGLARLARDPAIKAAARQSRGDTYMHFARRAEETPELTGGTEGFMAPEVKAGNFGDVRSDIYALGVIARLLLTGRGVEVGMKPLAQLYPGIGHEWDRIVNRCLCADPTDRYASGAEFEKELAVLAGDVESRRVPPWVWVFPAPVLALSVFAAVLALRAPESREAVRAGRAATATASVVPPPLSLRRIREHGLKPADADLGYGLYRSAAPSAIAGWRVGSIAKWTRDVEPGRYRLSALYRYSSELGAKPARLAVRIGGSSLAVYLPVSDSEAGSMRAVLGEIEVTSSEGSVESELVEGPAGESHLRLGLLVLEPLNPSR